MACQLWRRISSFLFLVPFLFHGCGPSILKIPARGSLVGQSIETTVDSEIARYYLENYLTNHETRPAFDARIDEISQSQAQIHLDRDALNDISQAFSVDFAALFLANRLWQDEHNRAVQTQFYKNVKDRKATLASGGSQAREEFSDYLILLVPGWDYAENGHKTGADLAKPRELMNELGLESHLVEIPPTGSVEENAAYLSEQVLRHSTGRKQIILAGASSAGPAIHLALGELLLPDQLQQVVAWMNLGGILQGSPLIDYLQKWPRSWLFEAVRRFKGWDKQEILSMSAANCRARFKRLTIPDHILVINYLGLSLSGGLSKYSRDKYPILSEQGPNDGLTLLADIIAPRSITIVAPGSDHFFNEDPDINIKTVALAQTTIQLVQQQRQGP